MAWGTDTSFAQRVASLCCKNYTTKMSKKGKPQAGKEWTLLASVVVAKETEQGYDLQVVSMGTGSKCLGQSKMSVNGDVVNDSHAEVVARRGFLRYLYGQLQRLARGETSDTVELSPDTDRFVCRLKPGISIHMFTSHTPCGDASIFPKSVAEDECGDVVVEGEGKTAPKVIATETSTQDPKPPPANSPRKRSSGGDSSERETKKMKCTNDCELEDTPKSPPDGELEGGDDIYRTGAKSVPGAAPDPHAPGKSYHITSVLRTKPGRGDRTMSLSCSDKFSRWALVGIQGALISHFMRGPLYLSSIIVGKCPYSEDAMRRAVVDRLSDVTDLPPEYQVTAPSLLQCDIIFSASRQLVEKTCDKAVPASSSVIWWLSGDGSPFQEAACHGRRQGITTKNKDRPEARVGICKLELFRCYMELVQSIPEGRRPLTLRDEAVTYLDHKKSAVYHQEACTNLLSGVFRNWPRTPPDFNMFKLST